MNNSIIMTSLNDMDISFLIVLDKHAYILEFLMLQGILLHKVSYFK